MCRKVWLTLHSHEGGPPSPGSFKRALIPLLLRSWLREIWLEQRRTVSIYYYLYFLSYFILFIVYLFKGSRLLFFPAMVQHSCLPSFLFIILLPFSLSLYLPDSNPLLSFNNQVSEVHLYTGIYDLICFLFMIYKHMQIRDYLWSYNGWLPRHTDLFSLSFFPLSDNHRRGMYLQMTMDGRVSGSDVQTPYSEYLALKYTQVSYSTWFTWLFGAKVDAITRKNCIYFFLF